LTSHLVSVATRSLPLSVLTLWQSFDQMVEAQPQTPAVMIERQRKGDAHHKKHCQYLLFVEVGDEQEEKVTTRITISVATTLAMIAPTKNPSSRLKITPHAVQRILRLKGFSNTARGRRQGIAV